MSDNDKKEGLTVVGDAPDTGDVEKYAEFRDKAIELKDRTEKCYWEFGMLLKEIHDGDMYRAWEYDTWTQYVDEELEIGLRTVQMYIRLQNWFQELPSNIQGWIQKLGWTKARYLVGVVTTENAGEWRNRLANKTVKQIEEMMDAAKKGESGDSSGGGDGEGSGESSQEEKPKPKRFSLYSAQMENVERALNRASEITESDKEGHNLDMICLDFLANNTHLKDMQDYLKGVERATGYGILVYDEKEDALVYGDDLLARIMADNPGAVEDDEEETEE